MNKTVIFILLRTFSFIGAAFYALYIFKSNELDLLINSREITFEEYMMLNKGIRAYSLIMPVAIFIDGLFLIISKKKQPDGRILIKEVILPVFNYSDERESVLTGKAAKAGLAVILFYTTFVLVSYSLIMILTDAIPITIFMIFATASIPIVGLIAYYGSYRYYYSK